MKLLDKINGKKTAIGLAMHALWFVANIIFKDLSTPTETATGHALIFSVTGVGIGHKVVKNKEKINSVINNIKNK